jgi:hypothetical protein
MRYPSKVVSLLLILILVTVSLASPESFEVMRSQWTAHIPIRSRLMNDRSCPYCQQLFQPSRFHPEQIVCGRPECQRRRHRDYHRRKIERDPEYGQVVRDSRRKWREAHPNHQKNYWLAHPDAAERNRQGQRQRDQKRGIRNLVKNNLALDLKRLPAQIWLVGPAAHDLVKNNLASSSLFIFQPVGSSLLAAPPS